MGYNISDKNNSLLHSYICIVIQVYYKFFLLGSCTTYIPVIVVMAIVLILVLIAMIAAVISAIYYAPYCKYNCLNR